MSMYTPHIYSPHPIEMNATLHLDEKKSHHLKHVLRIKQGCEVTLFCGDGKSYKGTISATDTKLVAVHIDACLPLQQESPCKIRLIQGLCRFDKMDWIVQKTTELGIHDIYPCLMDHSDIKIKGDRAAKKHQHWQAVATQACEQAKRQKLPVIHPVLTCSDILSLLPASTHLCVLNPHQQGSSWPGDEADDITLITGPEGGFSSAELDLFQRHKARSLHLGPRILRTETTAITAISLAQFKYGDLKAN